jgi:glycosyltransferase involved in cell wall biosynthesis
MTPRIAVVLPTYGRAQLLRGAVESVLAQSETDFELWVVDDGSRDDTPALLATFDDPRLHVVRSETNRGGNWARNEGIRRSRAPILCFLDSDDRYLPGKLAFVRDWFDEHPTFDVLVDSFRVVDGRRSRLRRNPVTLDPSLFRRLVFGRALWKATPAISARRDALVEAGMFDESLRRRQDMDMLLRVSRRHACASSDRVTWVKHTSEDAISGRPDTFFGAVLDLCDRHPDYLAQHGAGVLGDLSRHFRRLLLFGRWGLFARDARRYKQYGKFEEPLARLLWTSRGGYLRRQTAE